MGLVVEVQLSMNAGPLSRVAVVFSLACASLAGPAFAQSRALPVDLPHATYPPIAQSARIQGDVEIAVSVRPDGTIASAAVSPPDIPFLSQAALDAAKRARFDCWRCDDAAPYAIVYGFRLDLDPCSEPLQDYPTPVAESPDRSRVDTRLAPFIDFDCHPHPEPVLRVRSWKCAWLWKCAVLDLRGWPLM